MATKEMKTMVTASDIMNQSSDLESILERKLPGLAASFLSSISPNWRDAAFSLLKSVVENSVAKRIQDAEWKQKLKNCICASDAAAMSQEQISSELETITEKLKSAEINFKEFILDENYLNKLAYALADGDGSAEAEHLSSVFVKVLHLFSDLLYEMPEFNQAMAVIARQNAKALDDQGVRLQRLEQKPHDAEEFLNSLPTLRLSRKKSAFAYDYFGLQDIWGRDTQIQKLCAFAEDDRCRFQFCVVTGPAGIGKSKLVFHFGRIYRPKSSWLVRSLSRKHIQELCGKKNWDTEKNILLIIDYANEQEQLADLLSQLSRLEEGHWRKIRLVLIAREGTSPAMYDPCRSDFPEWYTDIIRSDETISDHLFLNEFIELTGLTINDCTLLHTAYAANYLKRKITLADESNIQKLLEEVLEEDDLVRPLYALFVVDLYYRDPNVRNWDLESLHEQICVRDWNKWKAEICGKRNDREKVFLALTNLLLYATIFDKWESSVTLPEPLAADCKTVFDAASGYATDYKSKWFKILTGKNVVLNRKAVLVRLTPDMVGEYYALKRLFSFDDNTLHRWAVLMAAQLVDCKDFFVRAVQDFGNNPAFIEDFSGLFNTLAGFIARDDDEAHKAFASILETFFRNYKGNENDGLFKYISIVLKKYIKNNRYHNVYAAELSLLFHDNRPHMGMRARMGHLKRIERLYARWPESCKITSSYISFLGDIAASIIGANAPGHCDAYISRFEGLSALAGSPDEEIKNAFIPVLVKAIERANSVQDWQRSAFLEDTFLQKVIDRCGDDLALDFIGRYDSVIIFLAKQRAALAKAAALAPLSESQQLEMQAIHQKLEKSIAFFQRVIDNYPNPSVNFVWTYIGKLTMVTKSLFIYDCSPYNESLFQYMLDKLQEIYSTQSNSILAWRASRALDGFCDAKSEDIPSSVKQRCILKKPA